MRTFNHSILCCLILFLIFCIPVSGDPSWERLSLNQFKGIVEILGYTYVTWNDNGDGVVTRDEISGTDESVKSEILLLSEHSYPTLSGIDFYDLLISNIKKKSLFALTLLDSGVDLKYIDKNKKSLLYHALMAKNIPVIKKLLSTGVDPLFDEKPNLAYYLIQLQDVSLLDMFEETGGDFTTQMVFTAANLRDSELVYYFINKKVNLDELVYDRRPLFNALIATKKTTPEILILLLKNSMEITKKDSSGRYAFDDVYISDRRIDYIDAILSNAKEWDLKKIIHDKLLFDLLRESGRNKNDESMCVKIKRSIVSLIRLGINLTYKDHSTGRTALFYVVRIGWLDIADILLQNKAPIQKEPDKDGNTFLHTVAEMGYVSWIEKVIKAGLDPNSINKNGNTPILIAMAKRHIDAVKTLLKLGADPYIGTYKDKSFFHYLISSESYLQPAEILSVMDEIKDPDKTDSTGNKPLYYAVARKHGILVNEFLKRKVSFDALTNTGDTLVMLLINNEMYSIFLSALKDKRCHLNILNNSGLSALHYVLDKRNYRCMTELITSGIDVNLCGEKTNAPVFKVLWYNTQFLNAFIKAGVNLKVKNVWGDPLLKQIASWTTLETFEMLIRNGADPFATDKEGKTILMSMTEKGNLPIVTYMVEKLKVNLNTRDNSGRTVLSLVKKNQPEIYQYLKSRGAVE